MERVIEGTRILIKQGDLTLEDVDAIVNAANPSLLGGGGVDGAIHKAGGPAILEACKAIRETSGPLPTGETVITTGGRLKARYVVHTVGPVWSGGDQNEENLLKASYQNSLTLAQNKGLSSIAFPSISTGAYGFPVQQAARAALKAVVTFIEQQAASPSRQGRLDRVTFVLFSAQDYQVYREALEEILS
jgi:O-acetyl-ADP-ribose deacetylase (regulator of RNase III)